MMVTVKVTFDYDAADEDELTLVTGDIITDVNQDDGGWWEGTNSAGKRGVFPDNFVEVVPDAAPPPVKAPSRPGPPPVATSSNKKYCKCTFDYEATADDELDLKVGDVVELVDQDDADWWSGTFNGKTGMFPSNFVEETAAPSGGSAPRAAPGPPASAAPAEADKEDAVKAHKVQGVGFGNIFAGGSVTLRKTGSVSHSKRPEPAKSTAPAMPVLKATPRPGKPEPPKPEPVAAADTRPRAKVLHEYEAQGDDELALSEGQIVYIVEQEEEIDGWWMGELDGKQGLFPNNFVEKIAPPEPAPAPVAKAEPPKPRQALRPPGAAKPAPAPAPVPAAAKPAAVAPPPASRNSSVSLPKPKPAPAKPTPAAVKPAAKPVAFKKPPPPVKKAAAKPPAAASANANEQEQAADVPPWKQEMAKRRESRGTSLGSKPAPTPTTAKDARSASTSVRPTASTRPEPNDKPQTNTLNTSQPSTTSVDEETKAQVSALATQMKELTSVVDKLRKTVMVLTSDLDDERGKTAKMQIEIDRLKKLSAL
eukprot:m.91795 g.91795  ORF g.91795 m.91795 type:complete len:536 (+) comp14916_c0_seq1:224-1831(+)